MRLRIVSVPALSPIVLATAGLLLTAMASTLVAVGENYWPTWRGPHATGVSKLAKPPLEWSETKNIKWKVEIPGRGSASPVIWDNKLFLMTALPVGVPSTEAHTPRGGLPNRTTHRFIVLAIDRNTGKTIWERTATEGAPHEASHPENGTWASSSIVTDGEHVIAFFESKGLYAYDMNGKLLWQKDLGDKTMRNTFGEGSTPALHGNRLVVVWDHQGASFIVTLDKRTGEEIWRANRDEIDSWATPLIIDHGGQPQVITSGMNRVRSYDLESGKIVWESGGLTMNPIPSPVFDDGMVFLTSGFRGNALKAIRLEGARGDITGSDRIVWTLDRDTPYVPSPLLYDGILYILKSNNGILSVFDAKSGKPHYQLQRLEAVPEVFASPVAADGRVYFVGRDGATLVIRHGSRFEVLATNRLDDGFDASPALVDGTIYLRGYRFLYAIGN